MSHTRRKFDSEFRAGAVRIVRETQRLQHAHLRVVAQHPTTLPPHQHPPSTVHRHHPTPHHTRPPASVEGRSTVAHKTRSHDPYT